MLHEIKNVRQEKGGGRRRWFESEGLELVVWLDQAETVIGFQLCFDLGDGLHALTWRNAGGFAHSAVDTGDESPFVNRTPVLQPAGNVPWAGITRLFDAQSGTLEPALRQLVHDKLSESAGANAER